MSLNPFEVRLQVLSMAKDLLTDQYHTNRDMLVQKYEFARQAAEGSSNQPVFPEIPEFPQEDKIIAKANALYNFISTKS